MAPSVLITHQSNVSNEMLSVTEVLWWLNKALAFADFYQGKCTRWLNIDPIKQKEQI